MCPSSLRTNRTNPFGRGRDADYSTPPAQIRTSASTHTALTLDAWRQSAHRGKGAEHGVGEAPLIGNDLLCRGNPVPLSPLGDLKSSDMDLSRRRTGQARGLCRLCETKARLEESHIIPAFVYKWLKASAAASFMRFGTQPNKRVQDGFKRFWLCGKCEDTLNGWETKFANKVFSPFNKDATSRIS